MDPVQSDKDSNIQIPVWDKYKEIVKQREGPNVRKGAPSKIRRNSQYMYLNLGLSKFVLV